LTLRQLKNKKADLQSAISIIIILIKFRIFVKLKAKNHLSQVYQMVKTDFFFFVIIFSGGFHTLKLEQINHTHIIIFKDFFFIYSKLIINQGRSLEMFWLCFIFYSTQNILKIIKICIILLDLIKAWYTQNFRVDEVRSRDQSSPRKMVAYEMTWFLQKPRRNPLDLQNSTYKVILKQHTNTTTRAWVYYLLFFLKTIYDKMIRKPYYMHASVKYYLLFFLKIYIYDKIIIKKTILYACISEILCKSSV
jgi:hypothetical protein